VSASAIGTYDAYQLILLISGHSNRHKQQIEEVKADANFQRAEDSDYEVHIVLLTVTDEGCHYTICSCKK
jgi:hypothetical protein